MTKTLDKIQKIRTKISDLNLKIKDIQDNCFHPIVKRIAKSNSGNYDPHADSYWYEFYCQECGKYWQEDQTEYNNRMRSENFVWEHRRTIIKE